MFKGKVQSNESANANQRALERCALIFGAGMFAIRAETLATQGDIIGPICLGVYEDLSAQLDPAVVKILEILNANSELITVRKDKTKEPIDLENDRLIYRHSVKKGKGAFWFEPVHLKDELGRNATRLLKDLNPHSPSRTTISSL